MRRALFLQSFLAIAFTAATTTASAASLTIAWDPPTDGKTAGYVVLFGTAPGSYTNRLNVGLVTQRLVDGLPEGVTYYFAVQAYSSTGELSPLSAEVSGTTAVTATAPAPAPTSPPSSTASPFSGTASALPGTVQAENFDHGGAGLTYVDTTPGNAGGQYRSTDVDIEATSDSGGGYNVGWTSPGESLVYTVNVQTAGTYQLNLRVASRGAGGRVHVEFGGVDKTGPMWIPDTGSWQKWTTISAAVSLAAGVQTMRLVVDAAGASGSAGNLNRIEVTSTSTGSGGGSTKTKPSRGKPAANVVDDTTLEIAWEPTAADSRASAALSAPVGYRVEVGTAFGETAFSALTTSSTLNFDMSSLPAEKYFVRVRPAVWTATGPQFGHVSQEAEAAPSRPIPASGPPARRDATGTCAAPPSAPRQLVPSAQGAAVALNWQPGPGDAPSAFVLKVGTSPGQQDVLVTQFAGDVHGVTATAGNAAYALQMSAVNACGSSVWMPEAMLYVGVEPLPGMPRGLSQQVTDGLVVLTWEPPATGGMVTRYLIEATTPGGPFVYDTGTSATGFANPNTPPGQYMVTIRAGNSTGFGVASAPVLVVVP